MKVEDNKAVSDYREDLHSAQERQRLSAMRKFVELGLVSDWPGEKDRTFIAYNATKTGKNGNGDY